jgi:uncharacterized protein (TIGR02145 family)
MNGSAIERSQGVCPTGWHIPSDCEWMFLEHSLGMSVADQQSTSWRNSGSVGSKISTLTSSGNNNSGFTALLPGYGESSNGGYDHRGTFGWCWTSAEVLSITSQGRQISIGQVGVLRNALIEASALSVRCLKD